MRTGLIEAAVVGTTDPATAAVYGVTLGDAGCDYVLERTDAGLHLAIRCGAGKPLRIDFDDPELLRRAARPGHELLLRAVGGLKAREWSLVDMTAGLGRDAFVMASRGMRVTMLERSPVLAALLTDGLARRGGTGNLSVVHGDSLVAPIEATDVVYLDPMYPEGSKSALNKLSLRVLRDLAGHDPDADGLLPRALELARRRVVVKRPKAAPHLAGRKPDHSHRGKAVRWDVYLV